MRIRKIAVDNFRNLKHVTVSPGNPLVIVGENNTGKTNLLHSLRLLLGPESRRLEADLSEEDVNDAARDDGEDRFSVTVQLGDLQKHQELGAVFMERLDRDGTETFVTVRGVYERDADGEYVWQRVVLPPSGHMSEPIPFRPRMARLVPLYYLDAARDAGTELRATGRGLLARLLEGMDLSDVADDIVAGIREANTSLGRNAGIEALSAGITDLLNPNIPGGEGGVSLAVASEDPSQVVSGLRLGLQREPGGRSYDITKHGTGLQNLVLIAVFRQMLSAEPVAQPILAIEEPEAHLHVHAQRTLFDELAAIQLPIILTTHSPTLVASANPLSLVRLKPEGEGCVSSHQINPTAYGRQERKLLARMMRSGRSDALFARAILLVEGPSEVALMPAFARLIGQNLERDGVSIVPAEGNAFSFVLRACAPENFSIPTVVVFDADALNTSNDLVREAYKSGLLERRDVDGVAKGSAEARRGLLESIGWHAADPNLEFVVAEAGYLGVFLEVIDEEGLTGVLDSYLERQGLDKDSYGVSRFLCEARKGKGIKVVLAHHVADRVEEVGKVPECYRTAIEASVARAMGGGE